MRMYDIGRRKGITLWIGSDGRFITSLSSFIFETKNNWNIQAITDCKLYIINRKNHFRLNKTEPKWLEFDNYIISEFFCFAGKEYVLSTTHNS